METFLIKRKKSFKIDFLFVFKVKQKFKIVFLQCNDSLTIFFKLKFFR